MPDYICQVIGEGDALLPEDYVTNTIHFQVLDPLADAEAIAQDVATLFAASATNLTIASDIQRYRVKMYDRGDAIPRPVVAEKTAARTGGAAGGPREVALCLSFYAERNLPRQRGRIYLGPLQSGLGARPILQTMNFALDLAEGIAGIGGVDVDWQVFSPTDQQGRSVTAAWVDDEWDTQRRRGRKSTQRVTRLVGA